MTKHIAIIQGHPDIEDGHLCHALACAYREAAQRAGHEVRQLIVAELDMPLLHSQRQWEDRRVADTVLAAQELIAWADHLLIVHPLWLGSMPAMLKGFLEQVFRPGFAVDPARYGWKQRLGGRSARVVVTMGMPALVFRVYFLSHGVASLVRSILRFSGIRPVRTTLIGRVQSAHNGVADKWLPLMSRYGELGI